jgi:hypothetical protein
MELCFPLDTAKLEHLVAAIEVGRQQMSSTFNLPNVKNNAEEPLSKDERDALRRACKAGGGWSVQNAAALKMLDYIDQLEEDLNSANVEREALIVAMAESIKEGKVREVLPINKTAEELFDL